MQILEAKMLILSEVAYNYNCQINLVEYIVEHHMCMYIYGNK